MNVDQRRRAVTTTPSPSPSTSGCRKVFSSRSSYNFAKNLSDIGGYNPTAFAGAGGGQTTDYYNPNLDYGNVAFTRRHRFLTTFLYESPFSHTRQQLVNQVAGGWELAGVLLFQTGPFLTVSRHRRRSFGH